MFLHNLLEFSLRFVTKRHLPSHGIQRKNHQAVIVLTFAPIKLSQHFGDIKINILPDKKNETTCTSSNRQMLSLPLKTYPYQIKDPCPTYISPMIDALGATNASLSTTEALSTTKALSNTFKPKAFL